MSELCVNLFYSIAVIQKKCYLLTCFNFEFKSLNFIQQFHSWMYFTIIYYCVQCVILRGQITADILVQFHCPFKFSYNKPELENSHVKQQFESKFRFQFGIFYYINLRFTFVHYNKIVFKISLFFHYFTNITTKRLASKVTVYLDYLLYWIYSIKCHKSLVFRLQLLLLPSIDKRLLSLHEICMGCRDIKTLLFIFIFTFILLKLKWYWLIAYIFAKLIKPNQFNSNKWYMFSTIMRINRKQVKLNCSR